MMAATYIPIQSITLSASAASVTFSAIPQTYTDLVLRVTARGDDASTGNYASLKINAIASNYSETYLYGSGTTPSTGRFSARPNWLFGGGWYPSAQATANTFSSTEIYLPNYAGATSKVASVSTVQENNSAADYQLGAEALLLGNTAAITSLVITAAANFVSGSTFHLYGIRAT